jgi:hypothetical protein
MGVLPEWPYPKGIFNLNWTAEGPAKAKWQRSARRRIK